VPANRAWDEFCVDPANEEIPHRFYARTMGCTCCSAVIPLTTEELRTHIADLQLALSKAQDALAEIELHGEKL